MSAVRGHEAPQVARDRGFYKDPDPRFKDLKGKFDDAARTNGDVRAIKQAAIMYVLGKFALLDESGDPVVELTQILKDDDFGYTNRRAGKNDKSRDEKPQWGPRAGITAGGAGDRAGWNSNESYGGV